MDDFLKTSYNVHDEYSNLSIDELREIHRKDSFPFAVCAINLNSSLNIGTMIRTACIFGAEKFFVFGRKKFDLRSCVGSQHYLDIIKVQGHEDQRSDELDTSIFHNMMAQHGYTPAFIEQGGHSINQLTPNNFEGKACLVFGSEASGIPSDFMCGSQHVYSIPQRSVIRSLNVSASAAIAIWEYSSKF